MALGHLISQLPIIMLALMRNMKSKLMVRVAFILFLTAISHNGGRQIIAVLRESHAERISMRSCLTVIFLFIEVMVKLPYSLLLMSQSQLIISLDIGNEVSCYISSSNFSCRSFSCAHCRHTIFIKCWLSIISG